MSVWADGNIGNRADALPEKMTGERRDFYSKTPTILK